MDTGGRGGGEEPRRGFLTIRSAMFMIVVRATRGDQRQPVMEEEGNGR